MSIFVSTPPKENGIVVDDSAYRPRFGTVPPAGRIANRAFSANRTLLILAALGFGWIASTSSALAGAGDLDTDFGVGGTVTTNFSGDEDEAVEILEVDDGKLVAVGTTLNSEDEFSDIVLARYDEDGNLDPSFGDGGKVTTDFGPGIHYRANGAAIDDEGRIVVVGSVEDIGDPDDPEDNVFEFLVARFNADGSLDTDFGSGGLVTTSFPTGDFAEAEAVVVEDDEIVVVGAAGEGLDEESQIIQPDFAIARYDEDGELDDEFGDGGLVITDFSGEGESFEEASDVIVEDDKIIVAGFSQADEDASEDFALARYNEDGSLDESFGEEGLVTTDFDLNTDVIESIALQENEDDDTYKIVAGGITVIGTGGLDIEPPTEEDFGLVRYNADGSIDETFNTGGEFGDGKVVTDFGEGEDQLVDVAVEDGKIVAVGKAIDPEVEDAEDFALARYNDDGSLDETFGDEGIVMTDITGPSEQATSVIIEDDRIIAAGHSGGDVAIAVYEFEDDDDDDEELAF